jgi:hypothetical protein
LNSITANARYEYLTCTVMELNCSCYPTVLVYPTITDCSLGSKLTVPCTTGQPPFSESEASWATGGARQLMKRTRHLSWHTRTSPVQHSNDAQNDTDTEYGIFDSGIFQLPNPLCSTLGAEGIQIFFLHNYAPTRERCTVPRFGC